MSKQDSQQPPEGAGDEPFLSRWSRLKTAHQHETTPPLQAEAAGHTGAAGPDTSAPADGSPPAVELPDIEQLDQDSDYSAFLSPGVDAALKRRALRKLFSSPKFNVFDGLDTYRDDFTSFPPLGAVVTADMRYHLERIAKEVVASAEEAPSHTPPAVEAATPVNDAQERPAALPPARTDDDADHGPA